MNTVSTFIESLLLNLESVSCCFDVSHAVQSGCVKDPCG